MRDGGGTLVKHHLEFKGIKTHQQFERHVERVEEDFRAKYKGFAERSEQAYQEYRRTARFDLVTGFEVEGVYGKNAVLNYKVQGPAFHCLLKGLIIELQRRLRKHRMRTLLVGTIHDSVLGDCPPREVSQFLRLCRETMCEWLPSVWRWIIVPLGIEAKGSRENWHELEALEVG